MLFQIALKLAIGLVGLLIVVRVLGHKSLSKLTPFDLVYTFVLGGILEEAIYEEKVDIGQILFALAVWGLLIYIIESLVQRTEKLNHFIKGKPAVLVIDGKLNLKAFERHHVEMEQLRSMLRQQECFSLKQAKYVVLEPGGHASIMMDKELSDVFTYLVVDEGKLEENTLKTIGHDEKWLHEELKKEGHDDIKKIVYAEWSEEEGFYVKTYEESLDEKFSLDS